ncbi:MAG: hypothetical protein Q4D58_05260 [Synergistaceae bacterium]|nr:hypothetical protein [Synergistaceae bacterium]
MKEMKTIASIDIGSNAVRFLVGSMENGAADGKKYRKVAFVRVPIRLGEDSFTAGKIGAERRGKLCEAMNGFSHLMKSYGVLEYRAYATSALRDAKNGAEVIAEIREKSGLSVEIISGEREAEIIYAAARPSSGDGGWDKNSLHVDVGGGSTEVVVYADGRVAEARSFHLGTVRMLKGAVTNKEKERFKGELRVIAEKYRTPQIIGSGGNINKAQKLLNKREDEPLYFVELKMLYDSLKRMSFKERMKSFKLNPYRADVIIPALKIFLTISRICRAPEILVPRVGLVDGILEMICDERRE